MNRVGDDNTSVEPLLPIDAGLLTHFKGDWISLGHPAYSTTLGGLG